MDIVGVQLAASGVDVGVVVAAAIVIEALDDVAVLVFVTVGDSLTVAVFVIVWPAVPVFTVAVITSAALAPDERSPTVQAPVELANVPWDVVASTKVRPPGNTSVAVTPVEVAGPSAETIIV